MDIPENIKIITTEDFLKKHPEMFFGSEGASEQGVANILSLTAKHLGASDVKSIKRNDFMCVCSDKDWLILENKDGLTEINVFYRLWPFPEGGVNAARIEAIAKVYSSILVSARKSNIFVVKGSLDAEEEKIINKLCETWERVICFKYENTL